MSARDDMETIKRVLVALDASAGSEAALRVAASVAAAFRSELAGVFVEDEDLLNLAALPFACEVMVRGGAIRRLDAAALERDMKARAAAARRLLSDVAAQSRLQWSFSIERGSLGEKLGAAAAAADIVCVGRDLAPTRWRVALASRAARSGHAALLYVGQRPSAVGKPIIAVDDGTAAGRRAVQVGGRLATATGADLVVLITAADAMAARSIQDAARARLAEAPRVEFTPIVGADPDALMESLRVADGQLVIMSADAAPCVGADMDALIAAARCPVLVLKAAAPA